MAAARAVHATQSAAPNLGALVLRYVVIWFRGVRILLVTSWSLLVGCADLLGPHIPQGSVLLSPLPAEYEGWWTITEGCSGLDGELRDVEWRVLPGRRSISEGHHAVAAYLKGGHQIVLVEGREREGHLVRHEMLHALLAVRGLSGHPRRFFVNHCGGIVSCGSSCRDEVGEPPVEAYEAPSADPHAMEITARVVPETVSRTESTRGCVTIVVDMRNVHDEAVALDLSSGTSRGWSVDGMGGGGGRVIPANDVALLQPGEVRSEAYDCPERIALAPPGDYMVRGWLEGVRSDAVLLTIVP